MRSRNPARLASCRRSRLRSWRTPAALDIGSGKPGSDKLLGQNPHLRYAGAMKQETATSADRLRVVLQLYALALLLAMFICALHAGIIFSLGDFLTWLHHWARPTLGRRPTDILVVLTAISGLFVAHIAEASMWAAFFWKSGHLASFGDGWYYACVSHTALGYGDVVLSKPWRSLGPICAINGLLTFGCSTAALFLVLQMVWHHRL